MEDNFLSPENILSGADLDNLFDENFMKEDQTETEEQTEETTENKTDNTTEVDPDDLFDEPESVGSNEEENTIDKEDSVSSSSSSPKNFYSSIANALREEGVFPDLSDEEIEDIESEEDFKDFWNSQLEAQMDARYKRVEEALNYGIHPTEIQRYENTLNYLSSITDEILSSEDDRGDQLRKALITQDFLNRGYSKERAIKEVNKSIQAGTDIEDAKEALVSNMQFYQALYNDTVEEAKEKQQEMIAFRDNQMKQLSNSINNDKSFFGDLTIDKKTRTKVLENISKPVYRDKETGQTLTSLQKYQQENPVDFVKNVGILYTLTNGFKNLDNLVNSRVKKGIKKGFKELEQTINNSSRNSDGSLNYMSGTGDESIFRGFTLDV